MSADAYSYVFVGVPITEDAFWVTSRDDHETCSEGHPRRGEGQFCELDGSKFVRRVLKTPSAGFRTLVEQLDWEPDNWEDLYQGLLDEGYIRNAAAITSSEDRKVERLVLSSGTRLGVSDFTKSGVISWTLSDIEDQFKQVQKLASVFGLRQAPELYLQQYWSV